VSVFVVPALDAKPWPTLGPQICDLLTERCVHGPGDLRGEPVRLDDEKRALVYRLYEVYPHGHARAGKRRFKRAVLQLRKGSAKTELAAWLAYVELHPDGPVRCDGFTRVGSAWRPVGRPVRDPYIPMVAYTEQQTEDLAYAALYVMCSEGPDADLFDVTLDRIRRIDGDGKAAALATAPDSNDGKLTTFQHFDETHRLKSPRQRETHQTMLANIPKRVLADPWSLETTTPYVPGELSVAEGTHEYAEQVAAGKVRDPALFFFYRWAPVRDGEDLSDPEQIRAAVREASGPALAQWEDFEGQVDGIVSLYNQPDTDRSYWEQVWLARRVASARQAFDAKHWADKLARPDVRIPDGDPVVLGFDGARWRDACGLVATHIETGFQWPVAWWESDGTEDWEVTDEQVDGAVAEAMGRWSVFLAYCDPPRFEANVAHWSGLYGDKKVLEWYTNRPRQIGQAMRAYRTAQSTGELTHSGDAAFARHVANARKGDLRQLDDDDTPLWTIYKERPDSTKFIDLAMAGCLSWRARLDALIKGGWQRKQRKMVVM
jgi:phage terminase large subunit-like protein